MVVNNIKKQDNRSVQVITDQISTIKLVLSYEATQYQLEQLVEYLTHNGFLITELKEDYNE